MGFFSYGIILPSFLTPGQTMPSPQPITSHNRGAMSTMCAQGNWPNQLWRAFASQNGNIHPQELQFLLTQELWQKGCNTDSTAGTTQSAAWERKCTHPCAPRIQNESQQLGKGQPAAKGEKKVSLSVDAFTVHCEHQRQVRQLQTNPWSSSQGH